MDESNALPATTPIHELGMVRDPFAVLAEAKKAATALADVIRAKPKKVIMNGEQYLEFEDWQTLGRFYGLSVKVVPGSSRPVTVGDAMGYEASAVVVDTRTGIEVSGAEAMCLNDEEKWSARPKYGYENGQKVKQGEVAVPMFQLRSMAQTRACAKAFRNVLAWVVVLAGFKPTPAEEMDGVPPEAEAPTVAQPQRASAHGSKISEPQRKRFYAIAKKAGWQDEDLKNWMKATFGLEHTADIPRDQYESICNKAELGPGEF